MLTRRTTFAATAALPALPALALAQATSAASAVDQAPGFYRSRVGNHVLTMVNDGYGRRPAPAEGFIRNANKAAVEAALRDAFMPIEYLEISYTVPILDTPQGLVAFDIGTGGHLGPTSGRLADNMRLARLDPAQVTHIVFTHFHADHCSGLTSAEDAVLYPNAQLHVPAPEWAYWMDDAQAARVPEAARAGFANAKRRFAPYQDRIQRFEPGAEVLPGVRSLATYGHTPGHTSYILSDGPDNVLIFGDVTNRPELFVRNPGWHAVFDVDPVMAEATRRRVLDMAASERMRIAAFHWPFPALGHVAKDGEGYRYVPLPWSGAV
jgi:glyoxylase-like metal-dependent hydrolase (beta-lactamase superfamily II)